MAVAAEKLEEMLPSLRRLLRTDLSSEQVADHLGIDIRTLQRMCRKHGICDLAARRKMIAYARQARCSPLIIRRSW